MANIYHATPYGISAEGVYFKMLEEYHDKGAHQQPALTFISSQACFRSRSISYGSAKLPLTSACASLQTSSNEIILCVQ